MTQEQIDALSDAVLLQAYVRTVEAGKNADLAEQLRKEIESRGLEVPAIL